MRDARGVELVPPADAPLLGPAWSLPGGATEQPVGLLYGGAALRRVLMRFVAGLRCQRAYLAGVALARADLLAWSCVAPIVLVGALAGARGAGVRVRRADAEVTLTGWAVVGAWGPIEALDRAADLAACRCQHWRAREVYLDDLLAGMQRAVDAADLPRGALDDVDIRLATRFYDELL